MSNDVKLTLRLAGKYELQSKLAQLVQDTIKTVTPANMLFQSCIVCTHFNSDTEICKMFNVRPPAKIIVFGCVKFQESDGEDFDIPF
jgi:hypothetical protein